MALQRNWLGVALLLLACTVGGYAALSGVRARANRVPSASWLRLPALSVSGETRVSAVAPVMQPATFDAAFERAGVVAPSPSRASNQVTATEEPQNGGAQASSFEASSAERLKAPSLLSRLQSMMPQQLRVEENFDASLYAVSYQFDGRIFSDPSPAGRVRGIVRRGDRIPAFKTVAGSGCVGGEWISVRGGFVCTIDGFSPSRTGDSPHYQKAPDLRSPLIFDYGQVIAKRAPRMNRVPTAAEEEALRAFQEDPTAGRPEVLSLSLVGDVFVAVDDLEEGEAGRYWRTVWGHYVREQDVELQAMPAMSGEILASGDRREGMKLPVAFVFGEERPLYRVAEAIGEPVGMAAKYARFHVVDELEVDGKAYVIDEEGRALERDHVRVARPSEPDEEIPAGRKWIHVDLDEQVLVAYEGRTPVFTTLVASGKEGYDTPAGVFRVQNKHLSITMSGDDPVDGHYEVEEVPWTMFYYEGFALHGAYWHDDFGKVRSHGCTNIAPIDARWLYYWTTPDVPKGWYAVRGRLGTYVSFTRGG